MSTGNSINQLFLSRKILITCGTGGVGKTTTSAAIGILAALSGKKTIVVTIDPAKRLATSLGFKSFDDELLDLTPLLNDLCTKKGIDKPHGSFKALIPQSKSTMEAFIRSLAPTDKTADLILNNPIYDIFSKEFSGASEYIALEKLDSLIESNEYDFIILDTPPSRNTLNFLKAPELLSKLFDDGIIKWLLAPTNQIIGGTIKKVLGVLEALTGAGFIQNLLDFAKNIFSLQETFTKKIKRLSALLPSSSVGYLMVCAPNEELLPDTRHFIEHLKEKNLQFDGIIINRTLSAIPAPPVTNGDSTLSQVQSGFESLQAQEKKVTNQISILAHTFNENVYFQKVPEFCRDVHSLEDLYYVAQALR